MCSVQVPTLHLSRPFQRLEHLEVKWESTERRRERSLHDLLEDALHTSSRHPSAAALGMLLQPHVRSLVIKSAYLCNLGQVMQDGHSSTLKRLTIDTWHVWSPLGLIQNADEGEIKAALLDILKLCPSLEFLRLGNFSVSEQEHLDITSGMLHSPKTIEGHHSIVEVFCRGRQISTLSIVADISHNFLSYASLPLRVLNLPGISWRRDTLSSIFVAFPQLEEVRMWAITFEVTPLSYIPLHSSIKRLVLLASTNSNYTPELESLSTICIFDWEDRLLGFHDAQRALVEVLADRCPKLVEARLFGWEYWKNFGKDGWAGIDDVRCLEGSLM